MFPPGASVLKGAIALGSLLLNPDSSLENLQRNRDQLNYNLEKIKLSNQNPKLKAILEKSLRVKIDILDEKIANPPEEIFTDFEKINEELEKIRSELIVANASIDEDISTIKDVIAKTFSSVSDQGYKVCNLINIRFLLYWKHLQHFFW